MLGEPADLLAQAYSRWNHEGVNDRPIATAGHRLVPHVADVMLEAWGTTRGACLEEAARGLVESFVDIKGVAPTDRVPVILGGVDDEDVLVLLLEEVIYVVEVLDRIPVRVHLDERADGSVDGFFETIPAEGIEVTGALPKGVSRSDLVFEEQDRRWRCRVLVDV